MAAGLHKSAHGNPVPLGMPTLLEAPCLDESVALAGRLGLDFIELNMNLPEYQIGTMPVEAMRRHIVPGGVYFTLHLDENLNVCDFNHDVAEAYLGTVLKAIRVAKDVGIPVLNMHFAQGVYFTLPEGRVFLQERYAGACRRNLDRFHAACEREIGGDDIRICIENCDGYADFARQSIAFLLESDVFALTLDVGHSHAAGGVDEPFYARHGGKLRHMHLHDALEKQNHLPLGDGEIDVPAALARALWHGCRCVLEVKTMEGLARSVARLRKGMEEQPI